MTRLTFNQRRALLALRPGPLPARTLRDGWFSHTLQPDSVRHVLRRLEDRELVRRLGSVPYRWQLTDDGHDALNEDATKVRLIRDALEEA